MSNSQATLIARYPEVQCQSLRREETEKGEVRQIGDALAHISYRGNRFKGLYMYKYSTSDNVW